MPAHLRSARGISPRRRRWRRKAPSETRPHARSRARRLRAAPRTLGSERSPPARRPPARPRLLSLPAGTLVVADTGDFEKIAAFRPQDSTTNPSLISAAARLPQYRALVDDAVAYSAKAGAGTGANDAEAAAARLSLTMDKLAVNFGCEILKLVPGYVSTELDARLSFDAAASVERARRIVRLYAEQGIGKERVLVKLASTWEGIKAAEALEKEGIHTNLTLLFCFAQAVAAADAGATLISPFVGRILDWHKKATGRDFAPEEDPGVLSVRAIYNYYKTHGYKTIVMGASFRSPGEVLALAGCDRLTISPAILEQLAASTTPAPAKLSAATAAAAAPAKVRFDEAAFRWAMNDDAMATEKLAEGIRGFTADLIKLEAFLQPLLA